MSKYIAFTFNQLDTESVATAKRFEQQINDVLPDWGLAFCIPGTRVYHSESPFRLNHVYRLSGHRGVILGRLFSRRPLDDDTYMPAALNDRVSQSISDSRGRHLINNFWGRYVAIIANTAGFGISILRDPTGAIPCFLTRYMGIDIVSSAVKECATLGWIDHSINWPHLAAYLCFGHMVTTHTGLKSVTQIHAGECVHLAPDGRQSSSYWHPGEIFHRQTIDNTKLAMQELRTTIETCVATWANGYDSILHELSGGLDSSVVLACLVNRTRTGNLTCETHYMTDTAGDERQAARLAASAMAVELVEKRVAGPSRPLAEMFHEDAVASPTMLRFLPDIEKNRNHSARTRGLSAVFSGQGGDHLFQSVKTDLIAAEYVWRRGSYKELLRVVADTAHFTRQSIWAVLSSVLKYGVLRSKKDPYDSIHPSDYLSGDALQMLDMRDIRHPWIENTGRLPSCKVRQIFDIVDLQNFYRTSRRDHDVVHPLISQPLIELCIQIPSYTLTYGGIDRALVRGAFSGFVPEPILRRTTKGATTAYFSELLTRNIPELRATLLDGNLVHHGLIDRPKVEHLISKAALPQGLSNLFTILDAYRAEIWSRSWLRL